MRKHEITLYGHGAAGINIWKVWSEGNVIHIEANGCRYTETVHEGKAGRSLDEQIKLRIDARARVKMDQGFKLSKEELGNHITNQLGLAAPMLAQPLKNIRGLNMNNVYLQPKLDGHRCLISKEGAYSRRGKPIETIPEIVDSLQFPDDVIFDGELYYHGVPLQTIASWAKRRQPSTLKLTYNIYDVIIPGLSFQERLEYLRDVIKPSHLTKIVSTVKSKKGVNPYDVCSLYRSKGYEGAILRVASSQYDIGKRSRGLIKVKMRYDEEFKCIGIEPSKDGWGILILETADGKPFRTSAPGDHTQKRHALHNKEQYIGRYVTCEFAELTKDGIPFHCVAIRWRNDI